MKDINVTLSKYLPGDTGSDRRDRDLQKACKEFESILTYQLLKSMRRTVEKCDLFHGGQGEEIYESFLDQELSKEVSGSSHNSLAGLLYNQFRGRSPAVPGPGGDLDSPFWPLKAPVSSEFGWRKDPIDGRKRFHNGVDLVAGEGTEVKAFLPGRVQLSGYQQGYGNLVVLDHGHGFTTLYAHNQHNLVKPGDWVKAGMPVAKVGSSGRSTGPHLHFEVRRYGNHLNPLEFMEG